MLDSNLVTIASPRPPSAMWRASLLLSMFAIAGFGGCGFFKSLAGANTVDLSEAEVKSMSVDIRKQQKTICPREPVQMAVFADVVFSGESEVKSFETWQGHADANKNDRLDFADFAFHSPHGSFDDLGWFTPNRDLLATVGTEFALTTAYKKRPDKFTFKTTYKPDYKCIRGADAMGAAGERGSDANTGNSGTDGAYGSDTARGGDGSDGGLGGNGGNGSPGGDGPQLRVLATMVKTPFYDRLIAVQVEGALSDLLLAHPEQKLVVSAAGGAGGDGGNGGTGGNGGRGGSGNPGGAGGHGGPGGNSGSGGNGGRGGTIELVFDERFPELAQLIQLDVSGGAGGRPGSPGSGGRGGAGGSGLANSQMGQSGSDGSAGSMGATGQQGSPGTSNAHAGDVASAFANVQGVTVL